MWETTYPTLEMVNKASAQTLMTWYDKLPHPQTDVERTIKRKIEKRVFKLIGPEVREAAPEVAEAWNKLSDQMKKMGLGEMPKM